MVGMIFSFFRRMIRSFLASGLPGAIMRPAGVMVQYRLVMIAERRTIVCADLF
jgi:hypothetical protein